MLKTTLAKSVKILVEVTVGFGANNLTTFTGANLESCIHNQWDGIPRNEGIKKQVSKVMSFVTFEISSPRNILSRQDREINC